MMNMKTALLSALLMVPSFAIQADDMQLTVGLDSDYFWRGVSQNAGNPSAHARLHYEDGGFYAGAWMGQVDFGTTADWEYDLYAGYDLSVTDNMFLGAGVIQYNYDAGRNGGHPDVEEVFVRGGVGLTRLAYYVNVDDKDLGYLELQQGIPFIHVVDMELGYGKHKDGDDFLSLSASKDLNDKLTVGVTVYDGVRHGKAMDSIVFSTAFNF